MKRPRGASEIGGSDDRSQTDNVKRSQPSQLLRKLRNAQRHRQAEIARPQGNVGNLRMAQSPDQQPDALAVSQWSRRGVLLALVPLSIVGMVSLFVMGFVGSREIVSFLVGREYVPTTLSNTEQVATEQVPAVTQIPGIVPELSASSNLATEPEATFVAVPETKPAVASPTAVKPEPVSEQPQAVETETVSTPAPEAETVAAPTPTVLAEAENVPPPAVEEATPTETASADHLSPPSQDADVPPALRVEQLVPEAEAPGPIAEASPQVTPVVEPPVVETQTVDAPIVETPVVETPVVETPVVETPVVETPVVETAVVETQVVEAPIVETPVVEPPVAEVPIVQVPVADTAVVEPPATETPVAESPAEQLAAASEPDAGTIVTPAAAPLPQPTLTEADDVALAAKPDEEEEPLTRRDNEDLSEELRRGQQAEQPAEDAAPVKTTAITPQVFMPQQAPETQQEVATPQEITTTQDVAALQEPAGAAEATSDEIDSGSDARRLIGEGHGLLASGDVVQARQFFSRSLATGSAEAALALGRSFDPKHLASIQNPNASADPVTARKWYEEWYRRSVEQGSISPKVRLDRLLQAMSTN